MPILTAVLPLLKPFIINMIKPLLGKISQKAIALVGSNFPTGILKSSLKDIANNISSALSGVFTVDAIRSELGSISPRGNVRLGRNGRPIRNNSNNNNDNKESPLLSSVKSIGEGLVGEILKGQLSNAFPNIFGANNGDGKNNEGTKIELISPDTLKELNTNFDSLKEKLVEVSEILKCISDEINTLGQLMINTFLNSTLAVNILLISLMMLPQVIMLVSSTINLLSQSLIDLTLVIRGIVLAIAESSNAIASFGATVVSTFSSTMNSLVTSATDTFNKVANIFKKEIKMNIKLPIISVSGAFSGNPLQVPRFNLSWYKTGGIFTGPSVIGVGEAGDEAVLPLSNKRRMKPFANAVASMMSLDTTSESANNKGVTINIDNMSVRNDMDIKKIANEINRLAARENRKLGII